MRGRDDWSWAGRQQPASAGGSAHDESHRNGDSLLVVSFRFPPARRGHGRHCKRPRRNTLSIKTKLIGGASALAIAGGMLAFAAPAANAAVTTIGTCQNLLALGSAKSTTINPATGKGYGITDKDDLDGALSTKGVDPNLNKGTNLGSCNFPTAGSSGGSQGIPNSDKPVG